VLMHLLAHPQDYPLAAGVQDHGQAAGRVRGDRW
jgi:hypothetical protein